MTKTIKILIWVLLAINVIFFAVMKSGLFAETPPVQPSRAMNAEKIILLDGAQNASAVLPVPIESAASTVQATVEPESCFEWGDFSGKELVAVMSALKKLPLGDKLNSREIDHGVSYWVYIAPIKDKAGINEKLAQLKARGVTDYFVVQEQGEWLNAISLGLFKTRESAQKFLEGLRAKDVRTAQMGERAGKYKATVLIINGLDAEVSGRLNGLQKNFPESELKRVSCH
ncbi:MAG: SPOR domain-containing protein [Gallionella sp.]|nr:SPOR domain-containing protein [Gallionella sp.]